MGERLARSVEWASRDLEAIFHVPGQSAKMIIPVIWETKQNSVYRAIQFNSKQYITL